MSRPPLPEPPGRGEIRVLLCTCPEGVAEELATFLVEGRHAACVNIVSRVQSVYRWEGRLEKEVESLLLVKCPADRVERTTRVLAGRHPYDVPEVLVLKVESGHAPYLDWVCESVQGD